MKPSLYLTLTFGWGWIFAGTMAALHLPLSPNSLPFAVLACSVGPAMFAWAGGILPPLGHVFRRTTMAAWLFPAALAWMIIALCNAVGVAHLDWSGSGMVERTLILGGNVDAARETVGSSGVPPAVLGTAKALVLGLVVFFPLSLAEEVIWRGVVFKWLRTPWPLFGRWSGAGLWALWCFPLLAISGRLYEVAAYLPFGVVLTGLRERSGGILAPALARGTFWAVMGLDALALGPSDERWTGPLGGFSFVALLILAILAGRWNHARSLGLAASPTLAEE